MVMVSHINDESNGCLGVYLCDQVVFMFEIIMIFGQWILHDVDKSSKKKVKTKLY